MINHLKVFFQSLLKRIGYLVEFVELTNALHGGMITRRARIQSLNDSTDIAKNAGVHQG